MNLCVYTCFVYLQPFCVTLDFKLFIDLIHILFLLYLLFWFWDFTIKNLQDFIKIYRALIKDIFPKAEACNGSSDSTQIIHQCDQNFSDSQMYISAVNFPLHFISVRRQMSPVSACRVAFVFRDFPIGFI